MAQMSSRQITMPTMAPYMPTTPPVNHFRYNEHAVAYNFHITYNYSATMGIIDVRTIATSTMEGRY